MFQQLSMIDFFQQGGLVLLLLAICSIISIAVIIERWRTYRAILGKNKKYIQAMSTLLPKKKVDEAINLCTKSPSMISDLYLAGLDNKGKSKVVMEEAVQRQVLKLLTVLERKLNLLATLGSTTPFIGLFGTVFGIIKTFRGMSFAATYSPSMVTSGIAEALLNTAAGLFVAIPAVIAYNYFSHQIQIFLRDTEILTSEMVEYLSSDYAEKKPEPVVTKPVEAAIVTPELKLDTPVPNKKKSKKGRPILKLDKFLQKPMYEINIIPFTDIVLVILVVFIVTTPLLIQSTIKVNLPQTTLHSPPFPEEKVQVTIREDNSVLLGDQPIKDMAELEKAFKTQLIYSRPVVVNADQKANYGVVAQVLGLAQKCGAKKLELLAKNVPE